MNDFLYDEPRSILSAAMDRHSRPLVVVQEAIELAHLAFRLNREAESSRVPGVPSTRRVRNEINDLVWRYVRAIAEPLEIEGVQFDTVDGGEVMVLSDGMRLRIKKGDRSGRTSNYPTLAIRRMAAGPERIAVFPQATPLDEAIMCGQRFDIVYVAGESAENYEAVGMRFSADPESPFLIVDPPSADALRGVSPEVYEIALEHRKRLVS